MTWKIVCKKRGCMEKCPCVDDLFPKMAKRHWLLRLLVLIYQVMHLVAARSSCQWHRCTHTLKTSSEC